MIGHGKTLSLIRNTQIFKEGCQIEHHDDTYMTSVAQEVDNDLMYSLYYKETGMQTTG